MSWPLITDFSRMLKTPRAAFRDIALQQCTIELNQLGQPKPRSGNFATVYRAYRPDGQQIAIRVFNRRSDERRERYRQVSEYLKGRSVSSLVSFTYDETGIRSASDGKLYPLLVMEWVPGVTMFEWARDCCHGGYADWLKAGAEAWRLLVDDLQKHEIVHGDLQHGNVLISQDGHFKLVDYDCMGVPSLLNQRNLEMGMVPYQHPGRTVDTLLFPGLDNFSALMIYVSLRALAALPQLWTRYVDNPGYDKLLLRKEDFDNPGSSDLYHDLMNSPDEQVRDLTHYLFQLVHYDIHDVPPIDEVLLWCHSLDELLSARDWDKALLLAERVSESEPITPEIQQQLSLAGQRVSMRKELEAAMSRGDENRVMELADSPLLRDYPAAEELVAKARRAPEVIAVLKVLKSTLQLRGWDVFKKTWREHQSLLQNRPSAAAFQKEMQKLLSIEFLSKQLVKPDSDDTAILDAWHFVEQAGGHETAEPLRPMIQFREQRQAALRSFAKVAESAPDPPTIQHDRRLVNAWQPGLLDNWNAIGAWRERFEAARDRIEMARRVTELTKERTLEAEQQIALAGRSLPHSYFPKLSQRLDKAEQRSGAYGALQAAIADAQSEATIVSSWRAVQKLGVEQLVPGHVRQRVALAESRVPLIESLRGMSGWSPAEQRRRVFEIWDEALLNDCVEAAPWRPLCEQNEGSHHVLAQIKRALDERQLEAAKDKIADAEQVKSEFTPDLAQSFEELKKRLAHAELARQKSFVTALLENKREVFRELFDTEMVKEICQKSPHHRNLVAQWVEREVLPLERIGLGISDSAITYSEDKSQCDVAWTWPEERVSNDCVLQVRKDVPKPHSLPDEKLALYSATITRADFDSRRFYPLAVDPAWEGCYLCVWAVVDLGFQVFYSQPLTLGQLQIAAKPQRRGLFRRGTPDTK